MESIDFSVRIMPPWAYIRADLPLVTDFFWGGAIYDLGLYTTWAYTRAVTVQSLVNDWAAL